MPFLTLTIPGSIRSKKNSKRPVTIGGKNKPRRIVLLPSKAYLKWEKEARQVVKTQLPAGFQLLTGVIEIEALFFCKGVLPDLSGACESLGDCLESVVYLNDKQIKSWDGSRVYRDKEMPRTLVGIFYD